MGLYDCISCSSPADDEYHYWETISPYGKEVTVEVVWLLCGECCEFAVDVVESISEIESEVERWKVEQS